MHLLATTAASVDDLVEAVDLRQPPGDIAILSFADSDLSGLAAAWTAQRKVLPTVRLANLRDLRHPLSVDLWVDGVGRHAKVILVRLLGGLDWWRYGVERLSSVARERAIALAVLPGEDRDDPRLAEASTLPVGELNTLLGFFREGGSENLAALLRRLASHAGSFIDVTEPRPVPRTTGYIPGEGAVDLDRLLAHCPRGCPRIPIIFYRAMLLAADTAPIDALCRALAERGLAPAPLVVPSLKDQAAAEFIRTALARLQPAIIVTATAFAAAAGGGEPTPFDDVDVPVLQAVIATTRRSAWSQSPRGLGPADLAMHVLLPELDGRVLQGVIAFKGPLPTQEDLCFTALGSLPEADRVAILADRIAALVALQTKPRAERRVAILLPDYPGAPGRAGYAVGLDVPASVVALLSDMEKASYAVAGAPKSSRAILDALRQPSNDAALPLDRYRELAASIPAEAIERVRAAWGDAENDGDVQDGAFRFRARTFGNVIVAFPPDRGRSTERRADYHDAILPPRHALLAFALWLRHVAKVDALIHMGAHGTFEWLPGKAVALTAACFPELVVGSSACDLSLPRQQSGGGGAGKAADRSGDHRALAAAARRGGAWREMPATSSGLSMNTRRRTGSIGAGGSGSRERSWNRPNEAGLRPRRRSSPTVLRTMHCDASMLGCAISRSLRSRTGFMSMGASRRALLIRLGGRAQKRNALRSWPPWMFAASRPGRPVLLRAVAATSCRPDATCSPLMRACCPRRPRPISAGLPPTRCCAPICKPTAKCRARR